MKKLMLILLMVLGVNSYSQADSVQVDPYEVTKLEEEYRALRKESMIQLSVGFFAHSIGSTAFISGPITDPDVASQFIMYSIVGVTFDVFAIVNLCKARKKKKELESILNL